MPACPVGRSVAYALCYTPPDMGRKVYRWAEETLERKNTQDFNSGVLLLQKTGKGRIKRKFVEDAPNTIG